MTSTGSDAHGSEGPGNPARGHGRVALVGSGEYLEVMVEVEGALLAGRPPRYVQLPTAAAPEGPESVAHWVGLGAAQAERLGVEAVAVMVDDRRSADDEALAARIPGAGLVYLSGGNPAYLADTLRGTRVWSAILEEWRRGAALAGCSAGAMALTSWVPDIFDPTSEGIDGLGVLAALRVIPHFDRLQAMVPELAATVAERTPAGTTLVGIDEETAIVSDDLESWMVHGRQAAWVFAAGAAGPPTPYRAGESFTV